MTDERNGLPSASNAEAYALCAGRWNLERMVGEPVRLKSDDQEASSGDRVHAALAGEEVTLTSEEQDTQDDALSIVRDVVEGIFLNEGSDHSCEHRMWLLDERLRRIFSGKADRIIYSDWQALVIDYKSAWGDQAAAPRNMQLRALAVLAAHEFDVQTVHTVIIQPKVTRKPVVCTYKAEDLRQAEAELRGILARQFDARSKRTPGAEQCRYCRAKHICQEANAAAGQIVHQQDRILSMSGEQLGDFLKVCQLAKGVIKTAEHQAKGRIAEDPNAVPGWELTDERSTREIEDIRAVHDRAISHGVPEEEFIAACGVTLKDLTAMLRNATGKKGRELDDLVSSVLENAVKIKKSARSLTQV